MTTDINNKEIKVGMLVVSHERDIDIKVGNKYRVANTYRNTINFLDDRGELRSRLSAKYSIYKEERKDPLGLLLIT